MPYGTIKIDTITFTDAGVDKSIAVSGLVQNPTFTGNVTVTGTVSGTTVRATTVSGVTVSGTTANFASGVFTTQISGAIHVAPAGTAGAPSVQVGTGASIAPGLYSPAIDQLGISTGGAFRLVVDSSGRVGIGTASPVTKLHVLDSTAIDVEVRAGNSASYMSMLVDSTGVGKLVAPGGTMTFTTSASERARIDSSGRLLVGTSSSITGLFGNAAAVQLNASFGTQALALTRFSANNFGADIDFLKSRNATVGAHTIVQSGDQIANLNFAGSDGTAFVAAAGISANIDGTPGTNDMPGRLVFSTTADGAASPTERMRIDSVGNVGIGGTPGSYKLDVQGGGQRILNQGAASFLEIGQGTATSQTAFIDLTTDTTYTDFGLRIIRDGAGGANGVSQVAQKGTGELSLRCIDAAPLTFYTTNTERARIDSSGRLLIGTSSARAAGGNFGGLTNQILFETVDIASFTAVGNKADASGPFLVLAKSRSGTIGGNTIVQNNDILGSLVYAGANGTTLNDVAARIDGQVDGTPGVGDMPGRLIFSTTADGAASPTERMRIDSAGQIGIGGAPAPGYSIWLLKALTGATSSYSMVAQGTIQSDVTANAAGFITALGTAAAAFSLTSLQHFTATQGTFGAGSSVTNQYGFLANANLTGATNNYGFFSNIASGANRWNFYSAGTADSYFASNNFIFANGGTERARVDSSGRLLVGTSSARTSFFGGTVTPAIQLEQSSLATVLSVVRNSADNSDPIITLCKTRGTANGSNTIVAADDFLGGITFQGADGVSLFNAATIRVNVDGAPGVGDMPGRLVFSTTTDGTTISTERLRITNDGVQAYNQPAPAAVNATATLTVANLKAGIITSTSAAATDMTLPTGTDTQAGFSGTYDNFTFEWSVINTGPSLVRVLAGTAHTVVGSGSVATGTSGRFASRRTAANTFVTYRLA